MVCHIIWQGVYCIYQNDDILPDQLLQKAKLHAQKNHMTMTRQMEYALRAYLATESDATPKKSWRIEPVGKGGFISPDLEANWPKMRDLLYERDV